MLVEISPSRRSGRRSPRLRPPRRPRRRPLPCSSLTAVSLAGEMFSPPVGCATVSATVCFSGSARSRRSRRGLQLRAFARGCGCYVVAGNGFFLHGFLAALAAAGILALTAFAIFLVTTIAVITAVAPVALTLAALVVATVARLCRRGGGFRRGCGCGVAGEQRFQPAQQTACGSGGRDREDSLFFGNHRGRLGRSDTF